MEEPTRETAREDTVSRGPGARNASLSSYATTKEATTSTTSSAGLAQPATAVLADAITPPRRHVRPIRRYSPMPHPVYGNNPLAELPSLRRHNPAPRPIAAVAYEQRVARRYLKICACLPILLPLYATGALDFLMRLHTRGVTRELPKWEKRASWGLLAAWIVVALCVVPFSTFLHYF